MCLWHCAMASDLLAVCCLLLAQLAVSELTVLYRDEPSSAQRQVAYDTMKLYRALHTQALQGKSAPEVVAPALPQYASCGNTFTLCYRSRQSGTPTEHPRVQPRGHICLTSSLQKVTSHHPLNISQRCFEAHIRPRPPWCTHICMITQYKT